MAYVVLFSNALCDPYPSAPNAAAPACPYGLPDIAIMFSLPLALIDVFFALIILRLSVFYPKKKIHRPILQLHV